MGREEQIINERKLEELDKIKKIVVETLKRYKIKKAGIFGSYVKGKQKKNSDVDIMIEPSKDMGLEFVGIKLELEDKLNKKVDLVTYKGIHPLIKNEVLKEEVRLI
jgi:predicted nucleotidyltransferase